jgi:hypothetical protein
VTSPYQLSVGPADAHRDLLSWLQSEESGDWEIRQSARPPRPGEMGTEEILTVIVSSGGLTALIRSLNLWIKYRQPKLHVSVTSPDGKTVVVDSTNAGDAETVLKAIKEQ